MQNNCMNVNSESHLTAQEREVLLRAEIVLGDKCIDEGLQLFSVGRDRKAAAVQQLNKLLCGEVA